MGIPQKATRQPSAEDGLRGKFIRGGAWLGTGSIAEQATRFGRNILLSRLLVPEDFGTMAVVLSVTTTVHALTDIGVREALIQHPRGDRSDYVSAAWFIAASRALVLYVALFCVAPLLAGVFNNPQLIALVRVASLGILLNGASSANVFLASRDMNFRKVAVIGNGSGICGALIALVLALMLPNVWSLVIGSLAESVISFLLSYLICPFLPRLTFHSQPFRELLSFSRGLFGLSFLNLIFVKSDIFVIGKVLGPLDLGLYTMAVSLVQAPTGFIMNLLGQTLLSGLAKIRNDDGRVIKILLDVTSTLLFLGLPCTVFLTVFGKSFLTLAYGQKYAPMAPVLALAGLTSLLNLANAQITTIFFAKGVPHLHRRCVIVMACSMVIVSYPLIKVVGPMGGQLACLLAIVMGYVVQIRGLRAITGIRFNQYVRCYFEPLILASVVLALCLGLRRLHLPYEPGSTIVCGIMVCIAAYAFTAALLFYDNRLRRSFGNGDAELRRW